MNVVLIYPQIKTQGATVSATLHADVTTVIVDKRCPQRFPLLKARLDELRRRPWEAAEKVVVDRAWVEECAEVCVGDCTCMCWGTTRLDGSRSHIYTYVQQCCILDKEQRHFVSLSALRVAATKEEEGRRIEVWGCRIDVGEGDCVRLGCEGWGGAGSVEGRGLLHGVG